MGSWWACGTGIHVQLCILYFSLPVESVLDCWWLNWILWQMLQWCKWNSCWNVSTFGELWPPHSGTIILSDNLQSLLISISRCWCSDKRHCLGWEVHNKHVNYVHDGIHWQQGLGCQSKVEQGLTLEVLLFLTSSGWIVCRMLLDQTTPVPPTLECLR
jgi:hypothetical protein